MEADGDEYVRIKRKAKEDDPMPGPYAIDAEWAKAKELERRPCGLAENDHPCVILEAPIKKWVRTGTNNQITRLSDGVVRLAMDTETGVLVQSVTREAIENERSGYEVDVTYSLKQMSNGATLEAQLFELPGSGLHEVKALTRWNAGASKSYW